MSTMTSLISAPDRTRGDICPGAFKLHHATDGSIGRVRFPGGHVRPQQWVDIARIATELGDGNIHVTTRGNMQFRGVTQDQEFGCVVTQAGFVPSQPHDKIRNIIASPLSPELWPLVDALDAALLATDATAGLSGRTLFGLDAGDGAIISQEPDFAARKVGDRYQLVLGGAPQHVTVSEADVPEVLAFAAAWWQAHRGDAWRLHETPEDISLILADIAEAFAVDKLDELPTVPETTAAPIGWIDNDNGRVTLGAGLRFGFFPASVAAMLATLGAETTITPWASLVIHDLDESHAEAAIKALAPLGLIFDADSPWLRITACTGLPGCAKSKSHTHDDAVALMNSDNIPDGLVHFSGCDRRCGHPRVAHTEYLAVAEGEYLITHQR
ncbi:precorrin-3B synthase [Corynebacterium matruchotii]